MHSLKFPLLLCLWVIPAVIWAQHLKFTPEKPLPGETITVQYTQAGSPLAQAKDLHIVAYALDGEKLAPADVALSSENGILKGTYTVPTNAKAVYFTPKSWESGDKDDNDGKGWGTPVYESDRQKPVSGYELSRAALLSIHLSYVGVSRNDQEAIRLFQENFVQAKNNKQLVAAYANMAVRNKNQAAQAQIKAHIQQLNANPKATEDSLILALALSDMLNEEALSASLTDKLKKKYPKGQILWQEKSAAFFNGDLDLAARKALVDQLAISPLAKINENSRMLGRMASRLASSCFGKQDWAGFERYAAMIKSPLDRASMFNNLAWMQTGESIDAPAGHLEQAYEASLQSLQLIENMRSNPVSEEQLNPYSPREIQWIIEDQYAMFADTYALILYKLGQAEEALKYQQITCDNNKFRNPENNERYCVYLEKAKGPREAEGKLEDLIAKGYATPAMKQQFKRLFQANHSSAEAADKYVALLQKEARLKLKEEVREKMIDEAAPTFALRNLQGETVDLASLRGKVVVIDFWATWCGPCVMSFPGMQRAQDAHKDRDDVVFLFVDTWESAADKEKNARDFIEKNKYTFNVLMDNDYAVVMSYKVEGIPTKFILDRSGRIRFRSVGYGGNEDALVDEMAFMIELAGE